MCIDQDEVCDEKVDCPTPGDDEQGCARECTEEEFVCLNGDCIPLYRVCDGYPFDCESYFGEDEDGCGQRRCPDGWFQCVNGRCIPGLWECDGEEDCDFREDEVDCGLVGTKCGNVRGLCDCDCECEVCVISGVQTWYLRQTEKDLF